MSKVGYTYTFIYQLSLRTCQRIILINNLFFPGRISAHLEVVEFDVTLVATEWFLCLFSKTLPSEVKINVKW